MKQPETVVDFQESPTELPLMCGVASCEILLSHVLAGRVEKVSLRVPLVPRERRKQKQV